MIAARDKYSNSAVSVHSRGFQYTVMNGYTLSLAFGWGNYCSNRNTRWKLGDVDKLGQRLESPDFELAVFYPNGEFVDLSGGSPGGEQVIGYVPASALPMLISAIKLWPEPEELVGAPLRARCRQLRLIVEDHQAKIEKEQEDGRVE